MRLLVLTREFPPHVVGGISYHLANLYSRVAAAGHDVTVIAGRSWNARTAATDLVHEGIDVRAVGYGPFTGHHLTYPLALERALRGLEVERFDVAVTHTPLPYALGIPTVAKFHDCPQAERPYFRQELGPLERIGDSLLNPTRRAVDRRWLASVDAGIFNSDLCRRAWDRSYARTVDGTTIHNGVDTEVFSPTGASPDEEYVLFVGDAERKGLPAVVSFAADADVPVYVVGDLDRRYPGIRALGRVPQTRLAELYSGAVATIHPAAFEAFGNVALESLACGTPVVTTSTCGASELLTDACGAVDVGLSEGVAHCRSLDPADCVNLAREHTWERVADRTVEVLEATVA